MKQGKKNFRHESLQDTKTIIKILEAMTEGLSKGKLSFSDEDDTILIEPEGLLHLKVKASQEDNRQRFSIQVGWQIKDDNKKQTQLKISS